MVFVVELAFIILDQVLLLFKPFICDILSRLRVKLETNRDFCYVTKVLSLKGQTLDISLNGLNGEIKSFYDLHKRTLRSHNDFNNDVIDEIWPKKRLSLLKQAMVLIESKWPSIKFHPVTFDFIDRQLNWLNYDLCLVEDWDFPNVMPNLSQFVGIYESKTNKWSEIRIAYSSPANRKFFLEFIKQKDTEVAHSKRALIKSGRKKQPPSTTTTTIPAGMGGAGKNVYRSQQQNIVDKSVLCIKWATFDEFLLNEARSRLVFYYTQIHPDLPSLYLVLVTILEFAGLIEPSSYSNSFCTYNMVEKFSNKSFDDIWKSRRWKNLNNIDSFNHYGSTDNDNSNHQIDRYTLILMIVAYFDSKGARLRCNNSEACLIVRHLIGFLTVYMKRRHDQESGCDSNDSGIFNENDNDDVDQRDYYSDKSSYLNSRRFFVVRPTFKQVGKLELVIENRDNPPNYYGVKSGLVVLDPIPRDGSGSDGHNYFGSSLNNKLSSLIGHHNFSKNSRNKSTDDIGNDEEKFKCFTNLTKDLETMIEIQRLFAHLRAHLYNIEHMSGKKKLKDHKNLDFTMNSGTKILNCERSSILQTLFTLSSKRSHFTSLFERNFGQKSQILTSKSRALREKKKKKSSPPSLSQLKETTTLKEISNGGKEPKFGNQNGVEWKETRLPYQRKFVAKNISISASKLGKLLLSFRWQTILTNFLYLGLFLLARNLLLGYLESFQSDLRDQARDDTTMQPKQTNVFDAKNTGPSSSSSSSNRYGENLQQVDNKIEDFGETSFGSEILPEYTKIHEAGKRALVEDSAANRESKENSKGRQSSKDEARDRPKLDDIDDKLLEELLDTILRQAFVDLG